jgi:hypothetical protein
MRLRRDLIIVAAVACLTLTAMWWSTRSSFAVLGIPRESRACLLRMPVSPSCFPEWHLQVVALLTLAVIAIFAGTALAIRRRGRATPVTFVFIVLIGLAAWILAAEPTRLLPVW